MSGATSGTVNGLTNGVAYTFTVTATNAIGTSPPSVASAPVTPSATPAVAFVQQTGTQQSGITSATVTLPAPLGSGHRLVVEVGAWSATGAVTSGVTDAAGDPFVEVAHWKGSDGTEASVWTAPVTSGGGQTPTITAHTSAPADVGVDALEYAGLSTVDTVTTASGTTAAATTVHSGQTAPAAAGGELALGVYADSGFGHALTGGAGWTVRGNISPNGNMDLLTEDRIVGAGATSDATVDTGANTVWLLGTVVFAGGGTAPPPTVPGAPTGVTATAGDSSATVRWTAPGDGGSPITSYVVTPYAGSTALPPTVVGATASATVTGLTNGVAYTFTVSASNAAGTGGPSTPSAVVTPAPAGTAPAFVQQAGAQSAGKSSLAVTLPAAATRNNRLVVEVGVWSASGATASSVTDSAGDVFTRVTAFTGSDRTQLSVWTAVVATGGTVPTVTAKLSGTADVGVVALEYAGLSTASGTAAVDQQATATGTTSAAQAVNSGPTPAVTSTGNLAIGFYADSGFGTALQADPGYTQRADVSPNGNLDLLAEDVGVTAGAMPAASATTGAHTVWLMATVVFAHG